MINERKTKSQRELFKATTLINELDRMYFNYTQVSTGIQSNQSRLLSGIFLNNIRNIEESLDF